MKKQLLQLILFIFPLILSAQPVITNAEDFSIGTVLRFRLCGEFGVEPGNAGPGVSWDFSSLTPAAADTLVERMSAPSATPFPSTYPTANLVEVYSDGRFVYVNKTAGENFMVGFVDTNSAGYIAINYPNSLLFAKRPTTYLMSVTDSFTDNFSAASFDFSGSGKVTLTADAYGTLTLPNGVYNNVMRVKIEHTQVDTLIQFQTTSTTTNITYAWFDGVHTSALLRIDSSHSSTFDSKTVAYLISESVGIKENRMEAAFNMYPNPAGMDISISTEEPGELSVMNSMGQVVLKSTVTEKESNFSTAGLEAGFYFVTFKTGSGIANSRLVIQH